MANNQGRVKLGIDFNVNTTNLEKIKSELKALKNMSGDSIKAAGGSILSIGKGVTKSGKNDLGEMRKELGYLEKAFEDAFNPKLGTVELSKFNASLAESGTTAAQVFQVVNNYGKSGQQALLGMATNMLAIERVGRQTNVTFQKLADTMMNTVRWSLTSSALNSITGSISKAYNYVVDLDTALNDIMIVTDKTSKQMENFAKSSNKAAKELGASTKDYAEASLIYYQQGLGDQETKARTDTTMKVAAITGQSADQVSEQLTAVWNGYKVNSEEAELYIDKLSAVAASTATDLEELSTGMSKVASAANIMGVDIDQLNAQIATIVSVTREAPESIGTALKTVYARMSDIEAGMDAETTLGEYTTQMAQMGINVLDANGKLRDMGAVVEEIGGKWNSLNREQQVSLAQSIAGTRQYSRMMALFDNWDMYQESLNTSISSVGTLSQQHLTYLDSVEAKQQKLKASAESLYSSIFKADEIKGVYEVLNGMVVAADGLVKSMGGLPGLLMGLGVLMTKFGKASMQDFITKQKSNKLQKEMYKSQLANGQSIIETLKKQTKEESEYYKELEKVLELEKEIYDNADSLTDEQWNSLQQGAKEYVSNLEKVIEKEKEIEEIQTRQTNVTNKITNLGNRVNIEGFQRNNEKYSLTSKEGIEAFEKSKYYKGLQDRKNKTKKGQRLSPQEREDLKYFEQIIPLLKEEIELREKNAQSTEELVRVKKKEAEVNEGLMNSMKSTLTAAERASKIAELAQGFTTVAFSASMASGMVSSFYDAIKEGSGSVSDWIGAFGGLAGVASTLAFQVGSAHKAFNAATGTAAKFGATVQLATGYIGIAVSVLSALVTVISEVEQKKIDEANATIESSRADQEKIQTVIDTTKAYLKLYETYQKTGEITDELTTAADAAATALGMEGAAAQIAAGKYDALTKSIRENLKAKYEEKLTEAREEKGAAEKKLETRKAGNTSGIESYSNAWDPFTRTSARITGSNLDDDFVRGGFWGNKDVSSAKALEEELNKVNPDFFRGYNTFANEVHLKPIKEMDPAELVLFYKALKNATSNDNWEPDSTIAKNVQKILNDEELKNAVKDYDTASGSIAESFAGSKIADKAYSKSTTITEFNKERDDLISQVMRESGLSEEEATLQVDQIYKTAGDTVAQSMVQRAAWLEGMKELESDVSNYLAENLTVDNISDFAFSHLQGLDFTTFKGTGSELLELAKRKAQEAINSTWANQKEARFESSNLKINQLERDATKVLGEQRKELIAQQNEELEKQVALLKEVDQTAAQANMTSAQEEFKRLANYYGFDYDLNIGDNWNIEDIRKKIQDVDNEDIENTLTNQLIKVINAQNAYEAIQEDILNKKQQIYDKNIQKFEAEIEYLETTKQLYNSIFDSMQSILDVQKKLYGEFGGHGGAAGAAMLAIANGSINTSKGSYESLLREYKLEDQWRNPSDMAALRQQLIDAAGAYVQDIGTYIDSAQSVLIEEINTFLQGQAQAITGKRFDTLSKDWEDRLELSEKYLDTVEKTYHLERLEAAVLQNINSLTNKNAQARLKDELNKQLEILEKMSALSEEDITRAEEKIKLLQAEINLEEARNAKNSMSLVRGPNGTYSYQYTADPAKILQAEEAKREAEYKVYQSSLSSYESNISNFQALYSSFAQEYAAATQDNKQAVIQRYTAEFQRVLSKNQNLLKEMQAYEGFEASGMQLLMTELAKDPDTFMEGLIGKARSINYSDDLNTVNDYLSNIASTLRDIAGKEGLSIAGYDTGGYTGSWGAGGRLALLHEKEIVLNKEDTANLLKGIDILRTLDLQMLNTVTSMGAGTASSMAAWELANELNLEQIVHINAEFPNATDKDEIKAAFDDLINLATQYAYKNTY